MESLFKNCESVLLNFNYHKSDQCVGAVSEASDVWNYYQLSLDLCQHVQSLWSTAKKLLFHKENKLHSIQFVSVEKTISISTTNQK